jgi:uncharacterized protein YcbX
MWNAPEIRVQFARIPRCAATSVNPETAQRDLTVPKALKQHFGHVDMGVYAEVVRGGRVAVGDPVAGGGRRPTRRPEATAGSRPRCARRSCT